MLVAAAHAWGKVRRFLLCHFRSDYVREHTRRRQGECRQCGSCCDLTFHCPFLNPQRQCKRYDRRTLTCRDFPIDAADLRLTRVPCGHYYGSLEEEARADSSG
jgi:hypothetical protein